MTEDFKVIGGSYPSEVKHFLVELEKHLKESLYCIKRLREELGQ